MGTPFESANSSRIRLRSCKNCGVHMGTPFESANSSRIRLRSSLCESWKNLSMRDSNC
jgi:hypothetical protein